MSGEITNRNSATNNVSFPSKRVRRSVRFHMTRAMALPPPEATHVYVDPTIKEIGRNSVVNRIERWTFRYCYQLVEVILGEGLTLIGSNCFYHCGSLTGIRLPSTVKVLCDEAFVGCRQLISIEIYDGVDKIGHSAFKNCFSLRNIAIPPTATADKLQCFEPGCHDLVHLFGSPEKAVHALQRRFDGLPIHKFCYQFACNPTGITTEQLNNNSSLMSNNGNNQPPLIVSATAQNNQDCLGMTPLHILACSSKQNIDLYKFILYHFPKSLIIYDKWECLPIFYALWSNAPQDIIQLLVQWHQSTYPDFILNWDKMISTLCRSGASIDTIQLLIDIQQIYFSEQHIDWYTAARELAVFCLVRCSSLNDFVPTWESMMHYFSTGDSYEELYHRLTWIQDVFFPNEHLIDWQMLCETLAEPSRGWWNPTSYEESLKVFQFLLKCSLPERLNTIGLRQWQVNIVTMVQTTAYIRKHEIPTYLDRIHVRLVKYERGYQELKIITFLLELALWAWKINEPKLIELDNEGGNIQIMEKDRNKVHTGPVDTDIDVDLTLSSGYPDTRVQCRVNCGADVIIPNVLLFLVED